ncbi:hypothetical protein RSAG8_12822, partial [Rhizoctonia solani AG-8 WAC10335]
MPEQLSANMQRLSLCGGLRSTEAVTMGSLDAAARERNLQFQRLRR